jgi:hypothetical protein
MKKGTRGHYLHGLALGLQPFESTPLGIPYFLPKHTKLKGYQKENKRFNTNN